MITNISGEGKMLDGRKLEIKMGKNLHREKKQTPDEFNTRQ